jgi:methionine-rich copper-binding protein CopC
MKRILFLIAVFCFTDVCSAQVIINQNALTYFQDFNTLDTVNSSSRTALPLGWRIAEHGASANNRYRTGDGSVTTNDIYSFGSTLSTERALGSVGGSTVDTLYYGVQFRNDAGSDVSLANITFKEEQWRAGDTGAAYIDSVQVFYSFTADSLDDQSAQASWIEIPALLMTSVVTDKYAVAIKGDTAFRVITAAVNMVVPDGSKLWLRWRDWNSRGSDDGLALDSLTVQFSTLRAIVTDKYPANNTTHLDLPVQVRIAFDQPVQKSMGSIYIKNETDQRVQIISASSGNVMVNGTQVLINGVNLLSTKTYHITFDPGAFLSVTGHSSFGIRDTAEWRFSTRVPVGVPSIGMENIRMAVLGTATSSRIPIGFTLLQAGPVFVSITDMTGRDAYRAGINGVAGDNIVQLGAANLAGGMYIIRLSASGVHGYVKCMIQ